MVQKQPIRDYPYSLITGGRLFAVTASPTDFVLPAKALRVYVPATIDVASITYVAIDDDDPQTVKFLPGVWWEQMAVKRVTAISGAGVEVHGVTEK